MSEWLKHNHHQHTAKRINYCAVCTSSADKHQCFITWRIIHNAFLWCLYFLIKLKAAVWNVFRWSLSSYIFAYWSCKTLCHLPFSKSHPVVFPARPLFMWQSIINVSNHSIYVHLMMASVLTDYCVTRCTVWSNLLKLCLCQQHLSLISLI